MTPEKVSEHGCIWPQPGNQNFKIANRLAPFLIFQEVVRTPLISQNCRKIPLRSALPSAVSREGVALRPLPFLLLAQRIRVHGASLQRLYLFFPNVLACFHIHSASVDFLARQKRMEYFFPLTGASIPTSGRSVCSSRNIVQVIALHLPAPAATN